jgi:hypothetical protein
MAHRPAILLLCVLVAAAQPRQLKVTAGQVWTDTGVDVAAGETIRIRASGELTYAGAKSAAKPGGMARGFKDMVRTVPVNSAGRGALIARIGEAPPFLAGDNWEGKVPITGRLFVGVNQAARESATGEYDVTIERVAAAPPPPDVSKLNLAKLSQSQLDSIPPRVEGTDGTPGDRVNFVIVGSEQNMKEALRGVVG